MYTIEIEKDLDLNIIIKFLENYYYLSLYIYIIYLHHTHNNGIHLHKLYNSKNIDNYCTMKSHNCQLINTLSDFI